MAEEEQETGRTWNYEGYCLEPNNFVTAFVHLYRAEVTRVNLWRSRLDTTTNWAVVTTGAVLTLLQLPSNPHFVMLLVLLLILTFMFIEARRYSYYALWHYRARLLETDFFAAMVAPPFNPGEGWGDAWHRHFAIPPSSRRGGGPPLCGTGATTFGWSRLSC